MAYVSVDELASWLAIGDGIDDPEMSRCVASAQEDVDGFCGWGPDGFDQGAAVATPRVFYAPDAGALVLPAGSGFWTATGLVVAVDAGNVGTYSETWAATDSVLAPLNNVWGGVHGFPYVEVHAVGTYRFPVDHRIDTGLRPRVQVTARWGWQTVPSDVAQATLMRAAQIHLRRRTADGTSALTGFRAGGRDRDFEQMLMKYRHPALRFGIA